MNVLVQQLGSNTHHRLAQINPAPEPAPQEPVPQEPQERLTWGECFEQGSDAMCRNTGAMFGGAAGCAAFGSLALGLSKLVPVPVEIALACTVAGTVVGAVCGAEVNAEIGEKIGNWGASVAGRNGRSERLGRATARTAYAMAPWIGAAGLLLTLA